MVVSQCSVICESDHMYIPSTSLSIAEWTSTRISLAPRTVAFSSSLSTVPLDFSGTILAFANTR